jgi:hypothetical protein
LQAILLVALYAILEALYGTAEIPSRHAKLACAKHKHDDH